MASSILSKCVFGYDAVVYFGSGSHVIPIPLCPQAYTNGEKNALLGMKLLGSWFKEMSWPTGLDYLFA